MLNLTRFKTRAKPFADRTNAVWVVADFVGPAVFYFFVRVEKSGVLQNKCSMACARSRQLLLLACVVAL